MPQTPEEIGQLIRQIRKERGLTQKEMGQKIGITESAYNRYETGNQNLTVITLQKVAEALNVKLNVSFDKS